MILLCTFLFGGLLSGCSNSNTDPQTETTVQLEETAGSLTGSGTFDWDTAMSQTTLDGKAIPMPFTMNDLGDEYHLGLMENNPFTDDGCTAELYNSNDDIIALLEFYHVLTKDYTNDCPIGYIGISENISVQGVQEGISMEQVYAIWGQPSEWTDNHKLAYYYDVPDERISLVIDDEEKISSMHIDFEYQETEESK